MTPIATQDPFRPHVWRFTPDPRDARIAELTTALRHIRQLAHDADALASVDPAALLAVDALAGAQPEPAATVEERTP